MDRLVFAAAISNGAYEPPSVIRFIGPLTEQDLNSVEYRVWEDGYRIDGGQVSLCTPISFQATVQEMRDEVEADGENWDEYLNHYG